jgi:hypothetical protein
MIMLYFYAIMITFRQIVLRVVLLIPACLLVCSSCSSTRHLANNGPKNSRLHSKYTGKHPKKGKLGSVKCHHVRTLFIDPVNLAPEISEKDKVKPDLTLIILEEQENYIPVLTASKKSRTNKIPPKVR